jgi:hypothetical protein
MACSFVHDHFFEKPRTTSNPSHRQDERPALAGEMTLLIDEVCDAPTAN